jgi:hypothetical protein
VGDAEADKLELELQDKYQISGTEFSDLADLIWVGRFKIVGLEREISLC